MKKRLAMIFLLIVALAALFAAPASAGDKVVSFEGQNIIGFTISGTYDYSSALEVLDLINEERAKEGIAPLTIDYDLTEKAMFRAAECSIYYNHTRPNGTDCFSLFTDSKYTYAAMGENIAAGQTSAQEVVTDWMNSPGHRKNIMNAKYRSVGIGCIGNVWVQVFSSTSGSGSTASTSSITHDSIAIQAQLENLKLLIRSGCDLNLTAGQTDSLTIYNINQGFPYLSMPITSNFYITSKDSSILSADGLSFTGVSEGDTQLYLYWGSYGSSPLAALDVHIGKVLTLSYTVNENGSLCVTWNRNCDGAMYYRDQADTMWTQLANTNNQTQYTIPSFYLTAGHTYEFAIRTIQNLEYVNLCQPITYTVPADCNTSGHSWNSGTVTTKATCTTDGVKTYTCKNCNKTKTETISATGHNWNSGKVTTKATCEKNGVKTYTCSGCGKTKTETISATGHNWGSGKVTKAPTALESGVRTYTCSGCGKTKTEKLAALNNPFDDLVLNSSYYDPVLWAVDKNITKGTSATEFSPKADCTRAQIVTFLWRYAGSPEPKSMKHNFVDIVEGSSYYKAVLWAVEKGITNGIDKTHFGPKEPCTRAQIVTFLWRYAGKPQPSSQRHNFTDIVKGSSYYNAVLWAVEKGITTGADDTHFSPKKTCTRAQGMTFLYRSDSAA